MPNHIFEFDPKKVAASRVDQSLAGSTGDIVAYEAATVRYLTALFGLNPEDSKDLFNLSSDAITARAAYLVSIANDATDPSLYSTMIEDLTTLYTQLKAKSNLPFNVQLMVSAFLDRHEAAIASNAHKQQKAAQSYYQRLFDLSDPIEGLDSALLRFYEYRKMLKSFPDHAGTIALMRLRAEEMYSLIAEALQRKRS